MQKLARILVFILSLTIIVVGLVGGGLGLLVSALDPGNDLLTAVTLSVSFLVLLVGCGLALAWHSYRAIQEKPSAPFYPKRSWILIVAFVLALIAGQVILVLKLLPVVTFPLFHVAAVVLPALVILGLAGWRLGGVTRWRDIALQTSSGALLATFLAMILETIVFMGLLFAALIAVAVQPSGLEQIEQLTILLEGITQVQDLDSLAFLARSPLVIAAVFLVAAVLIPLIEEAVKAIGVPFFAYRRPSLAQAFLWGLAGGAGFALAEGMFNAAGALEVWGAVALVRTGATTLHCFTGALMGLAWYNLLVERRWGRALGLYAASVSVHGLWNALTVAMTTLSLSTLDGEVAESSIGFVGLGVTGSMVLLGILALAVAAGLVGLTLYVAKRTPEPALSVEEIAVDSEMV